MLFSLIALLTNAFALDLNVDKYENKYTWIYTPDVIVCNDSPVSIAQVEKAAQAWREKGVSIGKVKNQSSNNQCGKEYNSSERGEIIVTGHKRFLDPVRYNGFTTKYHPVDNDNIVVSAIVEINPQTIKDDPGYAHKLTIHELGHAIGFNHHSFTKNDVMKKSLKHVH